MRRSRWILSAVTALLVGAGTVAAAAQSAGDKGYDKKPPAKGVTITAGDDGWVTAPGDGSQLNLADYPIAKIFGVKYAGHDKVILKGKPLSSDLGNIDTIIQRPKDIVLKGKKGSGPLQVAALSLEGDKPVRIGDKSYQVRVGLSETQKPGHITITQTNKEGGTFSASFTVAPKLVFTPEGGGQPLTVDCGEVHCGKGGKGFTLTTSGSPWTLGGADHFDAAAHKIATIRAGIKVGGEGSPAYTTTGTSNFFAGVSVAGGALKVAPIRHHSHFVVAPQLQLQP
jgi:hypothetical protein